MDSALCSSFNNGSHFSSFTLQRPSEPFKRRKQKEADSYQTQVQSTASDPHLNKKGANNVTLCPISFIPCFLIAFGHLIWPNLTRSQQAKEMVHAVCRCQFSRVQCRLTGQRKNSLARLGNRYCEKHENSNDTSTLSKFLQSNLQICHSFHILEGSSYL